MPHRKSIYTVGHSDHPMTAFVGLLCQHDITLVADVRSQPYSRWAPQYNREMLAQVLKEAGIGYRFMGDFLGGRPSEQRLYTAGRTDYRGREQTDVYQRGIEQLLTVARTERVALMCSEGDYQQCHRYLLITQSLLKRSVEVLHIKPDGETVNGERTAEQLSLF